MNGEQACSSSIAIVDRRNQPRPLADQGRAIRQASEHASESILRITNGDFGRIRVGAPPFLCDHLLSSLIAEFLNSHPGVRIELIPDFIAGLQDRLLADQIDMFIGAITVVDRTLPFEVERLTDDTNVVVCRIGHRLARARQIKTIDFEKSVWISHSAASTLHADMQATLTAAGVNRIKFCFESQSAGAVLKVLLSTDCLTMLPRNAAAQLASQGWLRILSFPHTSPPRPIGIVTHSERTPTVAALGLIQFLRGRLTPSTSKPPSVKRKRANPRRGLQALRR